MTIQQWAAVTAFKGILNDAEKDGKVKGLVDETNRLLTVFFPGDEKVLRRLFVERVVFPYAKMLLEDKNG